MSDGVLKCHGSALFLKRQHGYGYRLCVGKAPADCDADAITRAVQRHVFGAVAEADTDAELVFRIPKAR